MVRLLRLQTHDNNCIFDCNFDSDILIGEKASIGLKNLIFVPSKRDFTVNANSSKIEFNPETSVANIFKNAEMDIGEFSPSNIPDFLDELTRTLNRTLSFTDGIQNNRSTLAASSCFSVVQSQGLYNEHELSVNFMFSPVIGFVKSIYSIDGRTFDKFPENLPTNSYYKYGNDVSDAYRKVSAEAISGQSNNFQFSLNDSEGSHADFRYRQIARYGISKGSGVYYCRIRSSVAHGSAATPNGITFGITFNTDDFNEDALKTIQDKDRNFELVYKDPATAYKVRGSNVGGENPVAETTDSAFSGSTPIMPSLVNGGVQDRHDILMFMYDTNLQGEKCISCYIVQETGGTKLMLEYQLGKDSCDATATPYIVYHSNKNNITVDLLRFSPDVSTLDNQGLYIRDFPMEDDSPLSAGGGGVGRANVGANQLATSKVNLHQVRFQMPKLTEKKTSTLVYGEDLLRVLGLETDEEPHDPVNKIDTFYPDDSFPGFVGFFEEAVIPMKLNPKDFFIVEFLNLQLDSYDSSTAGDNRPLGRGTHTTATNGKRRNIIATVPFDGGTKGYVDFQANEVNFIDINNGIPISIRNLKVRVLDENFEEIEINTVESANMTLLLKDDSTGRRFV